MLCRHECVPFSPVHAKTWHAACYERAACNFDLVMAVTLLESRSGANPLLQQRALCQKLLRPCRVGSTRLWSVRKHKKWQRVPRLVLSCTEQSSASNLSTDPQRSRQHTYSCPPGYKIRYARHEDADQIGKLNAQVYHVTSYAAKRSS